MATLNASWHSAVDLMLRVSLLDARRSAVYLLLDELAALPDERIAGAVRTMIATRDEAWPESPKVLDASCVGE